MVIDVLYDEFLKMNKEVRTMIAAECVNNIFKTLKENYIPRLLANTNVGSFISTITTNDYHTILENLTNYSKNLIYNLLNDTITEITTIQNDFYQF